MKRTVLLALLLVAAAGPAPAQQVTVLSPNGGEDLAAGAPLTIAWSFSDLAGDEKIVITLEGASDYGPVAVAEVARGALEWPAGRKMDGRFAKPAADYRIRIVVRGNESVSDVSDDVFAITASLPVVALTAPNGGEVLRTGAVCDIRWSCAGGGGSVSLILLKDDRPLGAIAENVPAASLRFAWRVGAGLLNGASCPAGDAYRIGIQWRPRPLPGAAPPRFNGGETGDCSDGTFAISDD